MMKKAISKRVDEALKGTIDVLRGFAGDLTKEEDKEAAVLVLDWIKEAATDFDKKSREALNKMQ